VKVKLEKPVTVPWIKSGHELKAVN